jgi:peptidoglycan/LPS O-acetylase OafA/YrhL
VVWVVIAVVATAVGAWLIWRYVDLPFGTPKRARADYEETARARRASTRPVDREG